MMFTAILAPTLLLCAFLLAVITEEEITQC